MKGIAHTAFSLGVALPLLGLTPDARAQEDCLLTPVAVPGLSGLPFWYDEPGKVKRVELDDPRWAGGPVRNFANDPSGSSAAYRAVREGNILAVSFQALTDSNGASTFDAVYLGIATTAGGATARLLKLRPATSGAPDPVNTDFSPLLGSFRQRTGGGWGAWTNIPPTWLIDIDAAPGTQYGTWRNSPTGAVWAINIKVDLAAAGVGPSDDFRLFYALETHTNGSNCLANPAGCQIIPFTTPLSASPTLSESPVPEDPTAWQLVEDFATACTGGATLSPYNIGVNNADGTGHTTIDTTGTAEAPAINTFYADVYDIPNPAIPANLIRGKFSLAHWGSTIADSAADWDVVVIQPGSPDQLANAVPNTLVPAPAGPPDSTRIEFTCSTGASENSYCPLRPSAAHQHQCMLVELSAIPPQEVKFSRAAAYRNMNFETLSELNRPATISIRGLQALTGVAKDRDVYLYVKTINMPQHGQEPLWLPTKEMAKARRYAEAPLPRPPLERDIKIRDKQGSDRAVNKPRPKPGPMPQQVPSNIEEVPVLSAHQKLTESWPTYEVHVYYDSGELVERDGAKLRRLVAMVPFGFFLSHDGPLYGFTHRIAGLDGAVLEEYAPNWYKVRIPNEGSIQVQTTVTAEEQPPKPGGCKCHCEDCAPKEHTHPQTVPPHKHCLCNTPGRSGGGWTTFGLPLLLGAMAFARRRRLLA